MILNFPCLNPLVLRKAAIVTVLLLASACTKNGQSEKNPETVVELNLVGVENLNPNLAGEPSPIVLVVHELADLIAFEDADFNQLFYEGGILSIDRREFRIMPGDTIQIRRILDPETRFLGFVAGYRKIEGKRWRAASEPSLDIPESHFVVVGSEALSISETVLTEFNRNTDRQEDKSSGFPDLLEKIWPF